MTGFINGNLEDAIKGKRGFRSGRRRGPAGVLVGGRGGAPDAHGDDRVRARWPRRAGSRRSRTCCPCPRGGFGQDTVLTRAWAAPPRAEGSGKWPDRPVSCGHRDIDEGFGSHPPLLLRQVAHARTRTHTPCLREDDVLPAGPGRTCPRDSPVSPPRLFAERTSAPLGIP